MTRFYPVFLHLEGRRCVVVGSGPVAEQKVVGLLRAGARVTVISPDPPPRLVGLAADGVIELRRREYQSADLDGAFLAIVHSDDSHVRDRVSREAKRRRVLINAVDDMPNCSFIAPAVYEQGALAIAVSTAGKSPALAVRVRDRVADLLGPGYGAFLDLLGELRAEVARRVPLISTRTALWHRIVGSETIFESVRSGDRMGARAQIDQMVSQAEGPPRNQPAPASTRGAATPALGSGPGSAEGPAPLLGARVEVGAPVRREP